MWQLQTCAALEFFYFLTRCAVHLAFRRVLAKRGPLPQPTWATMPLCPTLVKPTCTSAGKSQAETMAKLWKGDLPLGSSVSSSHALVGIAPAKVAKLQEFYPALPAIAQPTNIC